MRMLRADGRRRAVPQGTEEEPPDQGRDLLGLKRAPVALLGVLLAAALAALASCASSPPVDLVGLTPAEVFQRAQDATEAGDYGKALAWYQAFREKYPDDAERSTWALYEIGFLHHKMGDDATALKLFDELLAQYQAPGAETLPPGPKALAGKVKALIQEQRYPTR